MAVSLGKTHFAVGRRLWRVAVAGANASCGTTTQEGPVGESYLVIALRGIRRCPAHQAHARGGTRLIEAARASAQVATWLTVSTALTGYQCMPTMPHSSRHACLAVARDCCYTAPRGTYPPPRLAENMTQCAVATSQAPDVQLSPISLANTSTGHSPAAVGAWLRLGKRVDSSGAESGPCSPVQVS